MLWPSFQVEKELWKQGCKLIAGIDEVGRGAWAGPVVSAAVVWQEGTVIKKIRDSKMLNSLQRERLAQKIKAKALSFAIGEASAREIDELGILVATKLSMMRALDGLSVKPDFLLVDAVKLFWEKVACQPIIKGDQKSISIAAASIVAKVYRDELMAKMDDQDDRYQFNKHKGYGTKLHQELIDKYGASKQHRVSWKCFQKGERKDNLSLFE
ncbi:MAG TPA: ribonuclease HII [bacterium]|nr:ribonuclease HII [bacterium]